MAFQSNKFNAFIAASATAVLVSTAVAPTASAANFKDVPDSSRYKAATDFLFTKGVKGFADGTFGVNANITRADAACHAGKCAWVGYRVCSFCRFHRCK